MNLFARRVDPRRRLRLSELGEYRVGLDRQSAARLGGAQASTGTLEQGESGFPLKCADVLAYRRRRISQACCGCAYRTAGYDGAEDAEAVRIKHHATIQCD